jgi:hypothetical protein
MGRNERCAKEKSSATSKIKGVMQKISPHPNAFFPLSVRRNDNEIIIPNLLIIKRGESGLGFRTKMIV